jgi:hypothetical protein
MMGLSVRITTPIMCEKPMSAYRGGDRLPFARLREPAIRAVLDPARHGRLALVLR